MAARDAARSGGVDAVEVVGTILQALLSLPRPARLKELESQDRHRLRQAASLSRQHDPLRPGHARGRRPPLQFRPAHLPHQPGRLARPLRAVAAGAALRGVRRQARQSPTSARPSASASGSGAARTIVRWFESNSPLSIRIKPGVGLSITTSATAKLLAAYQPRADHRADRAAGIAGAGQRPATRRVEAVYAEYAAIRKAGIAVFARRAAPGAERAVGAADRPRSQGGRRCHGARHGRRNSTRNPAGAAGRLLKQLGHELSSLLGHAADEAVAP